MTGQKEVFQNVQQIWYIVRRRISLLIYPKTYRDSPSKLIIEGLSDKSYHGDFVFHWQGVVLISALKLHMGFTQPLNFMKEFMLI